MPDFGTVGGAPNFIDWFQSLVRMGPVTDIFHPVETESPWLAKSEKERIDYILKIMPPPPMINWAVFQDISLHIPDHFGIHRLGGISNELKSFGLLESAILFGAAGAWAGAQLIGSELIQRLMGSEEGKNPLEIALQQYIANGTLTGVDARKALAALRNLPFLLALLQSVKSETVMQSYKLAEQQIILSLLDKWVEAEAQRAEQVREEIKQLDLQHYELMQQILRQYIEKTIQKQEAMTQPGLGIVLAAFAMGPLLLTTVQALFPALSGSAAVTISAIPAALQPELIALVSGLLATVTAWATTIAMSLATKAGGDTPQQLALDGAKAFALALASFITNPRFDQLIAARLDHAIQSGLIDGERAKIIAATLKMSLLLTALALLYKAQSGGLTAQELRGIIDGSVTVEEDNFLATLAKLFNEQLQNIPEEVREQLLNELLSPYDHEPPLNELVDPITTFIALWNPGMFQEMKLSPPG